MNKRGQQTTSMPFGMIFSIILIAVFLVVAITVGKSFLGVQDSVVVGQFYENLQKKVDSVYQSPGKTDFEIILPSKIKKVCFANLSATITNQRDYDEIPNKYSNSNLFLIPAVEDSSSKTINHLDIKNITKNYNPYCVGTDKKLEIKKDYYDTAVLIT